MRPGGTEMTGCEECRAWHVLRPDMSLERDDPPSAQYSGSTCIQSHTRSGRLHGGDPARRTSVVVRRPGARGRQSLSAGQSKARTIRRRGVQQVLPRPELSMAEPGVFSLSLVGQRRLANAGVAARRPGCSRPGRRRA